MALDMQSIVRAKIAKKRLPSDIKQLCESKEFQAVHAVADNMSAMWVKFKNTGGFYRNQTHVLEIKIGTSAHEYPFTAPHVKFLTPMFHTNVKNESICLSILKEKSVNNPEGWSEVYNLSSVVQAIFLLLELPNTASPYNPDAAKVWITSKQGQLEEYFVGEIDKYYFSHNYQTVIDAFDARYAEDHRMHRHVLYRI
jgi:ubiquitin-protein ligase